MMLPERCFIMMVRLLDAEHDRAHQQRHGLIEALTVTVVMLPWAPVRRHC